MTAGRPNLGSGRERAKISGDLEATQVGVKIASSLPPTSFPRTALTLDRAVSASDAVSLIRSGMRVFSHGASATPTPLLQALAERNDLENVRLYHLHTDGPAPWCEPERAGRIRSVSLFNGPSMRGPVSEGIADFVPIFLSDVPGG